MKRAASRMYWRVFHSRRFIPVRKLEAAMKAVLYAVCLPGATGFIVFSFAWFAEPESREAWATSFFLISAIVLFSGVALIMLLVFALLTHVSYAAWRSEQIDVLLDHFHYDVPYADGIARWELVPVPLDRKVLLLEAGIPIGSAVSKETTALTDEALRVMAALRGTTATAS